MTDKEASLVSHIANRHFRKKNGLCLVEGLRVCREAITRCPEQLEALYCTENFRQSADWPLFRDVATQRHLKTVEMSPQEFSKLSETETPQGIMLILRIPENSKPASIGKPFTLILDQVADPGNMGTILRTAWAVGLDSCWLVKGSADPYSPKAIRAGMGAQFALRTFTLDSLEEAVSQAQALGAQRIWCTVPTQGISIFSPEFTCKDSALIIGNEANGISHPELGTPVTIPMPGHAESLNAAQAATVFLVIGANQLTR